MSNLLIFCLQNVLSCSLKQESAINPINISFAHSHWRGVDWCMITVEDVGCAAVVRIAAKKPCDYFGFVSCTRQCSMKSDVCVAEAYPWKQNRNCIAPNFSVLSFILQCFVVTRAMYHT